MKQRICCLFKTKGYPSINTYLEDIAMTETSDQRNKTAEVSSSKNYYGNVNPELLDRMPLSAQRVLEIGCGQGRLGEAFKTRQPKANYFGVELMPEEAKLAQAVLEGVRCADIEQNTGLPQEFLQADEKFDTLVFGDVLEHLRDPWKVLTDLRSVMTPDGTCIACVPNVGHWSLVRGLLAGRWDYADSGLLDRTHVRFFTLETAVEMFQKAGWRVMDASPRNLWPEKTEQAIKDLLPLAGALKISPEKMRRDLSALQWVIRAQNTGELNLSVPNPVAVPQTKPDVSLFVGALGIKKFAGVTEARVDHPLKALSSLPGVRCVWGSGGLQLPAGFGPGVMMLHRQFMNVPAFNEKMEQLVKAGWLLVADMDDDPHHWPQFVENNFYAYRAVHAVTVSSEHLAAMVRQWNPHVAVFPNAMMSLPHKAKEKTNTQGGNSNLKVFFGALNRKADWTAIMPGIHEAALQLLNQNVHAQLHFEVVHDKEFFDSLPSGCSKSFYPTLNHADYMQVLAACDVALLPLNDTAFNRCKSDIKLIECGASAVAPICSPVVYGVEPAHQAFTKFAITSDDWRDALLFYAANPQVLSDSQQAALSYVSNQRMHSQQVMLRKNYYIQLMANRDALEADRQLRMKNLPQTLNPL